MSVAVLLYDGRRRAFRALADRFADCVDGLVTVPLESPDAKRFLEAQFGDQPFAFVFVEGESVHAGSAAVRRVLRRAGAAPAADLAARAYPTLAPVFGRVVHGQEPADLDGTVPLADAARDPLAALRGVSIQVD
ncbi:MAG: hypothetical protein V5A31_00595 [Haloferacaceae archaeon]